MFVPIIFADDRGSASDGYSYSNSFLNENIFRSSHKLEIVGGITYQSFMDRFALASVSGLATNITENYNLSSAEIISPHLMAYRNGIAYRDWLG